MVNEWFKAHITHASFSKQQADQSNKKIRTVFVLEGLEVGEDG